MTEAKVRVMWLLSKECGQPLEAGKGQEYRDSPLDPLEETQFCQHLGFIPISDLEPPKL